MKNDHKPVSMIWLVIAALIAVGAVWGTAKASGDELVNKSKNVLTGGDNTANNSALVGGSKTYAFAGGDVDINDCLYSWGLVVQGVKLNRWCAAERMDAMGLHAGAAMMRCTIGPVVSMYDSKVACETGQTSKGFQVKPDPEVTGSGDDDDQDRRDALEARVVAQDARLAAVEVQRVKDGSKVKEAEKVARIANAAAQKAVMVAQSVADQIDPELKTRLDADARRRAKARSFEEEK